MKELYLPNASQHEAVYLPRNRLMALPSKFESPRAMSVGAESGVGRQVAHSDINWLST
jgi:hypothetical protein